MIRAILLAFAGTLLAQASSAQGLRLASVENYTLTEIKPGDRIIVQRPFGFWVLHCDLLVSANRRVCGVEQGLTAQAGSLYWKLAQTHDGNPVLVFSVPPMFDAASGLTFELDGFSRNIPAPAWTCASACIAALALDGALQSLMLNAAQAVFTYRLKSDRTVTLVAPMEGFAAALDAAAEDPFGKRVQQAATPVPRPRPSGQDTSTGG